jgi:hypothetical protein
MSQDTGPPLAAIVVAPAPLDVRRDPGEGRLFRLTQGPR